MAILKVELWLEWFCKVLLALYYSQYGNGIYPYPSPVELQLLYKTFLIKGKHDNKAYTVHIVHKVFSD